MSERPQTTSPSSTNGRVLFRRVLFRRVHRFLPCKGLARQVKVKEVSSCCRDVEKGKTAVMEPKRMPETKHEHVKAIALKCIVSLYLRRRMILIRCEEL